MVIRMKSLLIHVCCAHCAAYTINHWREQGYEISAFWYNPNIHPYTEHEQRLHAAKALSDKLKFPLIVSEGYEIIDYFRRVAGHEGDRCRHCFQMRLSLTAEAARERDFGAFTTTLLISPHQKHELIHEIGDIVAEETGIEFLYADLRKRYSDSRHLTKPLDLYRQQYCGCVYSEWERYANIKIE
jgi:predicted adenine nucleotide alpha hydrolase (AANH) superfamily ATPase